MTVQAAQGYARCYHSHPALPIAEWGIYGGSCMAPSVPDADVYIGFDRGMHVTPMAYPWTPGVEFLFPIADMHAPADAAQFKALVKWVAVQLVAQQKVHVGCIGGHGRTGTFLAALVTEMTGNLDSIAYVREHYCQKAVESHEQIDFLHKHYGITKQAPTKGGHAYNAAQSWDGAWAKDYQRNQPTLTKTGDPLPVTVTPVMHPRVIWGHTVTLTEL